MTYNFYALIPVLVSIAYVVFVWLRVISASEPPEEYVPPEEKDRMEEGGYFTDDTPIIGDSRAQSALSGRHQAVLVRTVAVVLLLQAAAWSLWFLPAEVPDSVLARGEDAFPDDLTVDEVMTQQSPLQWRVAATGLREGQQRVWEVLYTVNRFTGDEDVQVSVGSMGTSQIKVYVGVGLVFIAGLLIYGEIKRYQRGAQEGRPIDF